MAKLKILEFPDPRLRKKAVPVAAVDDALRQLIDDMFETMYDAPGIGLAATQVDVHRRLLVADVSADTDDPYVPINPEIVARDGLEVSEEGCLSVPGYYEEVERAEHVRVNYLDRNGAAIEADFDVETSALTWSADGNKPTCPLPDLPIASNRPGPADAILRRNHHGNET